MMILDQNTPRADLEIAALFECGFAVEAVEKATDDELRDMIVAWIEKGDECGAC